MLACLLTDGAASKRSDDFERGEIGPDLFRHAC